MDRRLLFGGGGGGGSVRVAVETSAATRTIDPSKGRRPATAPTLAGSPMAAAAAAAAAAALSTTSPDLRERRESSTLPATVRPTDRPQASVAPQRRRRRSRSRLSTVAPLARSAGIPLAGARAPTGVTN